MPETALRGSGGFFSKDKEEILLRVTSPSGVKYEVWEVSHTTFPGPMGLPVDWTYLKRPAHYQ